MAELLPDPDLVEEWRAKIATRSGDYVAGVLSGWAHAAARNHGNQCSGCSTCDDFVWALSLIAAVQVEHVADPAVIDRLRLPDE
jgi:hypothetical protein